MKKAAIIALAALVTAGGIAALAPSAQAETMQPRQAQRWAKKWERQMKRNTRHASKHAACLNVRVPRALRAAARPSRPGSTSFAMVDWLSYGRACKRTSERAARYVKRTWRQIARPRPIVSAATWIPLLRHEGWPAAAIPTVLMVIRRESGGSPTAWNRSSDTRGLFQIMARYYPGYRLFDPVVNIRVALRMYKDRGWQPWSL